MNNLEKSTIQVNGKDLQVTNLAEIEGRELALVDLCVIQRLAQTLKKSSFYDIKNQVAISIKQSRDLEEMLSFMDQEIAFHKTINILTTVDKEYVETVGKIDLTKADLQNH